MGHIPVIPHLFNDSGQVVHTHVPLPPRSVFGISQRAVMLCDWEGNWQTVIATYLQVYNKADCQNTGISSGHKDCVESVEYTYFYHMSVLSINDLMCLTLCYLTF